MNLLPKCFPSFLSNLSCGWSVWVSHGSTSYPNPTSPNCTLTELHKMQSAHLYHTMRISVLAGTCPSQFSICSRTLQSLSIFQKILTINWMTRIATTSLVPAMDCFAYSAEVSIERTKGGIERNGFVYGTPPQGQYRKNLIVMMA